LPSARIGGLGAEAKGWRTGASRKKFRHHRLVRFFKKKGGGLVSHGGKVN